MKVAEAIRAATQAAKEYALARDSIRVEEVEASQVSGEITGWDIALSWLVPNDAAQQTQAREHPIVRPLLPKPVPPERRYARFQVRQNQPMKMKRLDAPR